jgi:DNA-binding HxlR family transcriptional regulator
MSVTQFQLESTQSISQKLFFSYRIHIMKLLLKGETDYITFKRELNLADGSLFSHLRALEQEGFVTFRKEFRGRKPATIYSITENYMLEVLS